MAKFNAILDNATKADSIVKEKYQANREAMVLLGKPVAEITAAIPAAGSQAAAASGSQVREGRGGEGRNQSIIIMHVM